MTTLDAIRQHRATALPLVLATFRAVAGATLATQPALTPPAPKPDVEDQPILKRYEQQVATHTLHLTRSELRLLDDTLDTSANSITLRSPEFRRLWRKVAVAAEEANS